MSNIASREEVSEYLRKTSHILNSADCNFSIQHDRRNEDPLDPFNTKNTLFALDDDDDVAEAISTLTLGDYSETVPNLRRPGTPDFWVFEKVINGKSIYVKFKIRDESNKIIFCMSFHFAKKPFTSKPYA